MFRNFRLVFEQFLLKLHKSSESGWKSSENLQKRCYQYQLYTSKKQSKVACRYEYISSCFTIYLVSECSERVRYQVQHSTRYSISTRGNLLSCICSNCSLRRKQHLVLNIINSVSFLTF